MRTGALPFASGPNLVDERFDRINDDFGMFTLNEVAAVQSEGLRSQRRQ